MRGSVCCSQQLKALALYLSKIHCFKCGRFSTVGAQGRTGLSVGGSDLVGQLHVVSSGLTTPELVHFGRPYTAQWAAEC